MVNFLETNLFQQLEENHSTFIVDFLETNLFQKLEESIDLHRCVLSVDALSMLYTFVYNVCTKAKQYEVQISGQLYNVLTSRAELVGGKYKSGSKARHMFITFNKRVFSYLDRFYICEFGLPSVSEAMEVAMDKGEKKAKAQFAARVHWRRVKHLIVNLNTNSKVQAQVDLWLMKKGLLDWTHAKCPLPHIKRARLHM